MIISFRHKGLKRLFEDGEHKGASAEHVARIENILGLLDAAEKVEDMNLPTFRLHPLIGDLKGFWSVACAPTGGLFFASRQATRLTLI